jgi:hypothetical protein
MYSRDTFVANAEVDGAEYEYILILKWRMFPFKGGESSGRGDGHLASDLLLNLTSVAGQRRCQLLHLGEGDLMPAILGPFCL